MSPVSPVFHTVVTVSNPDTHADLAIESYANYKDQDIKCYTMHDIILIHTILLFLSKARNMSLKYQYYEAYLQPKSGFFQNILLAQ